MKSLIILLIVIPFMISCGSGGGSTEVLPPVLKIKELGELPTVDFDFITEIGTEGSLYYSEKKSFTVGVDTKSFIIQLSSSEDSFVGFSTLIDPNGKAYIEKGDLFLDPNSSDIRQVPNSVSSIQFPILSEGEIVPGIWEYTAYSVHPQSIAPVLKVVLIEREHEVSARPTIFIEPILSSENVLAEDLDQGLSRLKAFYGKFNIEVEIAKSVVLDNFPVSLTLNSFGRILEEDILLEGNVNRIRVYFVDNLLIPNNALASDDLEIFGLSRGIPGSQGQLSTNNYIVINLSAFKEESDLDSEKMGNTLVHEVGHYLGLHHTSDATGVFFDNLNDTKECSILEDTNLDGIVDGVECKGHGGENIMFWLQEIEVTELTPQQFFIIQHSPIVK